VRFLFGENAELMGRGRAHGTSLVPTSRKGEPGAGGGGGSETPKRRDGAWGVRGGNEARWVS